MTADFVEHPDELHLREYAELAEISVKFSLEAVVRLDQAYVARTLDAGAVQIIGARANLAEALAHLVLAIRVNSMQGQERFLAAIPEHAKETTT